MHNNQGCSSGNMIPRQIGQVGNSAKPGGGALAISANSVYSTNCIKYM